MYPAPLFVKNTFINFQTGRSSSLEGFFEERQVLSCPTSCITDEPEAEANESDINVERLSFALRNIDMNRQPMQRGGGSNKIDQTPKTQRVQISIENTIRTGSPRTIQKEKLVSIGSVGHSIKDCKPCVFLHTRGCKSGRDCSFCHLCEAGEKKRRQKEKRSFFAAVRQQLQRTTGVGSGDENN